MAADAARYMPPIYARSALYGRPASTASTMPAAPLGTQARCAARRSAGEGGCRDRDIVLCRVSDSICM